MGESRGVWRGAVRFGLVFCWSSSSQSCSWWCSPVCLIHRTGGQLSSKHCRSKLTGLVDGEETPSRLAIGYRCSWSTSRPNPTHEQLQLKQQNVRSTPIKRPEQYDQESLHSKKSLGNGVCVCVRQTPCWAVASLKLLIRIHLVLPVVLIYWFVGQHRTWLPSLDTGGWISAVSHVLQSC